MNARRASLGMALCLAAGCGGPDYVDHDMCGSEGDWPEFTGTRSESLTVGGAPAGDRCRVTTPAMDRSVWIECDDPTASVQLRIVVPAEDGATQALGEGIAGDLGRRCGPPPGGGYPVAVEGLVTRVETREGQEGPVFVVHLEARFAETWTADESGDACLVFPAAELDLVLEGHWVEVFAC